MAFGLSLAVYGGNLATRAGPLFDSSLAALKVDVCRVRAHLIEAGGFSGTTKRWGQFDS